MHQVAASLADSAREACVTLDNLSMIGVSVPGPVNREAGVVQFAGNLRWDDYPLSASLGHLVPGVPIVLEDDARSAAVGEARHGAGTGVRIQYFITLSTGIGGTLVIDGQPYRGAHDMAGELGHITVWPGGRQCICGDRGCLEAVASGTAIAQQGQRVVDQGQSAPLSQWAELKAQRIASEGVFDAALQGDVLCREILEQAAEYMGVGVATIVHLFDPDLVVLGGGMMQQAGWLLPRIREHTRAHLLPGYRNALTIKKGELGAAAGLWGIYDLARQSAGQTGSGNS